MQKQDLINAVLSGHRLDAHLDDAENADRLQHEANVATDLRQSALSALLHREPCQADTLQSVYRLHRLWLRAGDPGAALRVIDDDGQQMVMTLSSGEALGARTRLAFWRIEVLQAKADHAELDRAFLGAERLLINQAASSSSDDAWAFLAQLGQQSGNHDLARRCAAKRHELSVTLNQRAAFRAWDDAVLAVRIAESYAAENNHEQARLSVRVAMNALSGAEFGQSVDFQDWLWLGQSIVNIAPDQVGIVVNAVRACVTDVAEPLSLARLRDIEVRLARLEAHAHHQQGQYEDALARAEAGRFILVDDDGDVFGPVMLGWLTQAGRTEQAAHLAFECVFNSRTPSNTEACELAMARLSDSADQDFHWPLLLACAATEPDTQWVCAGEAPAEFVARHLALAAARSPGNLAIDAISALEMARGRRDFGQALPLLEQVVQHPELANSEIVHWLWVCRMHVHGVAQALDMPFVPVVSGGWCYNVGVNLEHATEDSLPEGIAWPADKVALLAARYYALGADRYEAFFASGKGFFRDGDVHTYSMLCNNLAIHERAVLKAYDRAIVLHQRGIGASPFAEHFDGLQNCYLSAGNDVEFVRAADRLWHYATDHGYSRHTPCDYFADVAKALSRLDRDAEISIWLQRLDEWWQGLEAEAHTSSEMNYVGALLSLLALMAVTQPEDSLSRLKPALPRLKEIGDQWSTRVTGLVLERAGQHQPAIDWYEASLVLKQEDGTFEASQHEMAQAGIERCRKALRPSRPWWRFGA